MRGFLRRVLAGAGAAAVLLMQAAPGVQVQAAAPGTAAYSQTVNKAIMFSFDVYSPGMYSSSDDEPMDLSLALACAYADARPASMSRGYLDTDMFRAGTVNTNYSWDGAGNLTSRTVSSDEYSGDAGTWNYTWDGNGYLTHLQRVRNFSWWHQDDSANCNVTLGADGRPSNMDAPTIPYYGEQSPQAYVFAYDQAGRIAAVNVTHVYPSSGETQNYINTYTYNNDGTLRKVTKGDGTEVLLFNYDAQGRLVMSFTEVLNGGTDEAIGYTYDAAGRPVSASGYSRGYQIYQENFNYNY